MDEKQMHKDIVAALIKDGSEILAELTPEKCHIAHMGMGVAGEAGELLDAVKKHVMYNSDIDLENVIEEMGDVEFFLEGLRVALGITREETLLYNIEKLGKRYGDGRFTNEAAQLRADKAS